MKRRDFVLVSAATLIVPRVARAQKKTPVIGLLWNDSVKPSPYVATFLAAMGEKGYAAGRDIRIEDRVSLEGYGGYAEGAADLVRAKVDLILTYGATATLATAKATKEIPIVMVMGADPVARGLVTSLSRPGGNLTGVVTLSTDLTEKRFELLRQLLPGVIRVGVLLAPNVGQEQLVRRTEALASTMKLQPRFVEATGPGDIDSRIAELLQSGASAIYVTGSTMLASHSRLVVASIAKHRVPAVYAVEPYADAGGLMVYGPSVRRAFARAAAYVDRILKGSRPGDLAIEQVSDLELVINLKTAKALSIKIPQSILVRADRVIE